MLFHRVETNGCGIPVAFARSFFRWAREEQLLLFYSSLKTVRTARRWTHAEGGRPMSGSRLRRNRHCLP